MTQKARFLFLSTLIYFGVIAQGFSQQVEASLSEGFARVGQAVQLTVSVTDARAAEVPQQLNIDGLETNFFQRSSRFEIVNGRTTSSVNYTYLVIPLQEGNFTIPPIDVRIGGKSYKTRPLKLQVGGGGRGSVPVLPAIPVPRSQRNVPPSALPAPAPVPQPQQPRGADDKIAYGDLLIPKKTAYVGEVVPVELRFYFDANYSFRLNEKPTFVGDGFTVLRFSKPGERQQEIDGRIYNVVTFQTALVPAKTGTLEIPSATMETQVQVPGSMPPGFDSFFGDIFGNLRGMESRDMKLETPSVTLEVKPLPSEGRPDNFSGAIGQFGLTANVSPKKAASGDPVSLNVTIAGHGNFEAMGAPALINDEGWRTYPPSEKFQPSASDAIGLNGEKKFEYMMVAREDQSATPGVSFSYFEPGQGKYVTLSSKPLAVEARGGGAPPSAAAPQVTAVPSPQATPSATASPTPEPQRKSLLADTFAPADFTPLVQQKTFLTANGVLAAFWLGLLLFGILRSAGNSQAARKSAVRRETRRFLKDLEDPTRGGAEFFQLAAQFSRARLASSVISSLEVLETTALPAETKAVIREVLERDEELKYSTHRPDIALTADDRRKIAESLKDLDHATLN